MTSFHQFTSLMRSEIYQCLNIPSYFLALSLTGSFFSFLICCGLLVIIWCHANHRAWFLRPQRVVLGSVYWIEHLMSVDMRYWSHRQVYYGQVSELEGLSCILLTVLFEMQWMLWLTSGFNTRELASYKKGGVVGYWSWHQYLVWT